MDIGTILKHSISAEQDLNARTQSTSFHYLARWNYSSSFIRVGVFLVNDVPLLAEVDENLH